MPISTFGFFHVRYHQLIGIADMPIYTQLYPVKCVFVQIDTILNTVISRYYLRS